jgi:hypothetical protein
MSKRCCSTPRSRSAMRKSWGLTLDYRAAVHAQVGSGPQELLLHAPTGKCSTLRLQQRSNRLGVSVTAGQSISVQRAVGLAAQATLTQTLATAAATVMASGPCAPASQEFLEVVSGNVGVGAERWGCIRRSNHMLRGAIHPQGCRACRAIALSRHWDDVEPLSTAPLGRGRRRRRTVRRQHRSRAAATVACVRLRLF